MGYESKLYICEGGRSLTDQNGMKFAPIIAMLNLSKTGMDEVAEVCYSSPETKYYIYADDGNTKILEDRYGEKLREVDIDLLISAMSEENRRGYYRRYQMAIGVLETAKKDFRNPVVLHFGY